MTTLVNTLRYGDCEWFPKFVPTLEDWCQRHGHTLVPWTGAHHWEGLPCPKFCEGNMVKAFLGSSFDRMIYVDADVWVHPEAPDLPKLPGIAVSTDEHHLTHNLHFAGWCAALYDREFPLWEYSNAGVWSIDRDAAERLMRVWTPPFKKYFMEQHYFNAALCRAQADLGMKVSRLPITWNRWVGDGEPGWFQHAWAMEKDFDEKELIQLRP